METKYCPECKEEKSLKEDFYFARKWSFNLCKVCAVKKSTEVRRATRRTALGRIKYQYSRMKECSKSNKYPCSRLEDLCSEKEFITLCENSETWIKLFNNWVDSGYRFNATPFVGLKDSTKGYSIGNIQFLTNGPTLREEGDRWK